MQLLIVFAFSIAFSVSDMENFTNENIIFRHRNIVSLINPDQIK